MTIGKELLIGFLLVILSFFVVGYSAYSYSKLINATPDAKNSKIESSLPLTTEEVSKHSTPSDCWIVIDNKVLKITPYLNLHPGGTKSISQFCGKDATIPFNNKGGKGSHSQYAITLVEKFIIGLFGQKVTTSEINRPIDVSEIKNNKENETDDD